MPGDLVLDTAGVLVELSTDTYNNYAGFRMWFQSSGATTETHTTGQLRLTYPFVVKYLNTRFRLIPHFCDLHASDRDLDPRGPRVRGAGHQPGLAHAGDRGQGHQRAGGRASQLALAGTS